MPVEQPKENPIKALERQIAGATSVREVLRLDFARDRYVNNFQAMSGRTDGLQQFEAEAMNFMELANNKPEIMTADKFSIVAGFMRAAVWNLSFQGNDLSVFVRGKKLVVEPQAHGKRRLLEKMPGVKEVKEGVVIFAKDDFAADVANDKVHRHVQTWPRPEAKPENVVGAYCRIVYNDGHTRDIIIDSHEIAKARASSQMTDGGKLWTMHYGEAVKKTAYNRAFKIMWRKPEAALLYQQWEAPEEKEEFVPGKDIQDAQIVQEPIMPEAETTINPVKESVDKETGEVTTATQETQKERPRRGKPSDGELEL